MIKTLYNHITLITLLTITNLSLIHASSQYQEQTWHKPLVQLYYKGTKKNKRQDVQTTIELFKGSCENIRALDEINKQNIKPKMLNKTKLSQKGYDFDILKIYYLFTKKTKGEHLRPDHISIGNKALKNLYYKGTRLNGNQKKSMQEILDSTEDTKIRSNTNEPNYQYCAIQLAQLLKDNPSSHPKHSYENPNNTGLETTKIHSTISQLTINIDPPHSTNKRTLPTPVISGNSARTPEYSSDEDNRIIDVQKFKQKKPKNLQKQLKRKNAFSANDVSNLETFETKPEELRKKYQESIQLIMQQSEELTKLHNTKKKHKEKIQSLGQELLKAQQELSEAKNAIKEQNQKTHAIQYIIAITIGSLIGIAINQAIHKAKANTEKQEKPKESN